jgi:hypothetical protein
MEYDSREGLPLRDLRTHPRIVIAHHLILHGYGQWLPHDPRGTVLVRRRVCGKPNCRCARYSAQSPGALNQGRLPKKSRNRATFRAENRL